jgi:transposase-like protein
MSRSKVAYEKKVEIVRDYLEGRVGYKESIRRANNSAASFRHWVHLYKEKGIEGLIPNAKNNSYSEEVKRKSVEEYLSGKGSLTYISEKYGLRSTDQLRKWIKMYNTHGDFNSVKTSGGGSYMRQGRDTTLEERIQIVRDCIASGKNYGEMAIKYQVSYQQVRTWTLRFEEKGEAGLEDRRGRRKKDQTPRTELEQAQIEIEQLKHKLYLAEMENALLKKLDEVERRDVFRK